MAECEDCKEAGDLMCVHQHSLHAQVHVQVKHECVHGCWERVLTPVDVRAAKLQADMRDARQQRHDKQLASIERARRLYDADPVYRCAWSPWRRVRLLAWAVTGSISSAAAYFEDCHALSCSCPGLLGARA